MVIFSKKFGTLDPHLTIVWDKVPKKTFFLTLSLTLFEINDLMSLNQSFLETYFPLSLIGVPDAQQMMTAISF